MREQKKKNLEMYTQASLQEAPPDLLARAKEAIDEGKGTSEVVGILGKYAGDIYKTELLKEQIQTEKAQRANIYNTIANRNADNARQNAAALLPGGGKPPTEGQITNAGYADRINQANTIVDSKADVFKKMNYAQFKLAESNNILANTMLTPDQRQVAQAMRNFITAKLRKESGAAIAQSEFDDARLQYFPTLRDDEQTIANKKTLRDSVLNNLVVGSGNAYAPTPIPTKWDEVTGVKETIPGTSIVSGFSGNKVEFNIPGMKK